MADRLEGSVGLDGPVVGTRREQVQVVTVRLAQRRDQRCLGQRGQVAHCRHAEAPQSFEGRGADAPQSLHGMCLEEARAPRSGATTLTPSPGCTPVGLTLGLAASEASFATQLGRRHPHRAGEPQLLPDIRADPRGNLSSLAETAARTGGVEEGLVESDRLDEGRHGLEDLVHLRARPRSSGVVAAQEERMWAEPLRRGPTASPSGSRTRAPRTTRPRPRRAPPLRRRSPACRRVRGCVSPRTPRRTRPCRRGG